MAAPPGPDGMGLVALAGTEPERIVAVARYHRRPGAAEAELAVAVADAWHGLGLGTGLIEHLRERAAADGLDALWAFVRQDNWKMRTVFRGLGGDVREMNAPDECLVRIPLHSDDALEEASAVRFTRRPPPRSSPCSGPAPSPSWARRATPGRPEGPSSPRSPGAASPGLCTRSTGRPARSPAGPRHPSLAALAGAGRPGRGGGAGRPGPRRRAAGRRLRRPRPAGAVLRLLGGGRRRGGPRGRARAHRAHQRDADGRTQLPGHRGHRRWRALRRHLRAHRPDAGAHGLRLAERRSRDRSPVVLRGAGTWALGLRQPREQGRRVVERPARVVGPRRPDARGAPLPRGLRQPATLRPMSRGGSRADTAIVALKAGRGAAGQRAAGSHTAALAAGEAPTDALFDLAGVVRAQTLEELLETGELLAAQPLPEGDRVGIVSNAGGPAILAADACEAMGLVGAAPERRSSGGARRDVGRGRGHVQPGRPGGGSRRRRASPPPAGP